MAVVSKDDKGNATPIIIGYAESGGFEHVNETGPEDRFYKATDGRYPYYIVIHNGRYLDAPIRYGITLIDLCRDLGSDLYPVSKESPEQILSTHHQKSHIQITEIARNHLLVTLDKVFKQYGETD
ncbi:hypothetical protein J4772_29650 [Cohnella sp. LGH]|uniref:hypothetical protein n=1 Tax=Cohnella sp. LGH TaxID=1619153 RepID=UPI001ADA6232|nr:hypothetical protein [Cohnella sp. LGH]QTH41654.1 hypothetical protein J4772_29650 [Cohnella sp. LGH]